MKTVIKHQFSLEKYVQINVLQVVLWDDVSAYLMWT